MTLNTEKSWLSAEKSWDHRHLHSQTKCVLCIWYSNVLYTFDNRMRSDTLYRSLSGPRALRLADRFPVSTAFWKVRKQREREGERKRERRERARERARKRGRGRGRWRERESAIERERKRERERERKREPTKYGGVLPDLDKILQGAEEQRDREREREMVSTAFWQVRKEREWEREIQRQAGLYLERHEGKRGKRQRERGSLDRDLKCTGGKRGRREGERERDRERERPFRLHL